MLPKGNIKDWRIWWQLIVRRWFILLSCVLIGIGAGLYFAFTQTPEYEATSEVMILKTDLLSDSGLRFVPRAPYTEGVEYFRRLLSTADFYEKLSDSLDVQNNPKVIAQIGALAAMQPDVPREEITKRVCMQHLGRRLSSRKGRYNVVQLRARGETAEEAFRYCKVYTNLAIDESQSRQVRSLLQATGFRQELLADYKKRLDTAEAQLNKFDSGYMKGTETDLALSPEKLQEMESMVLHYDIELQIKADRMRELSSALPEVSQDYQMELEQSLADLKQTIFQRTDNVCQLFTDYGWRDTEITLLNDEIAKLKQRIFDRIRTAISNSGLAPSAVEDAVTVQSLRFEIDLLKHTRDAFADIVKTTKDLMKSQASREEYRARLVKEIETTRDIYELMQQGVQGAQIRESAQQQEAQTRFKLLFPPQRPLERAKPNRKLILMVSFMLGVFIGGSIIFGLEQINTSIRDVQDITEYFKVPVIGTIPRIVTTRDKLRQKRTRQILVLALPLAAVFAAYLAFSLMGR